MKWAPNADRETTPALAGQDLVSLESLLDTALARVGRLEAVVGATSGVLHDVNNFLTVLSGNLFLLTEAVRGDEAVFHKCRDARHAADHAGALIRELLTSRHVPDATPTVICPARHVVAIEGLLRRTVGSRHSLTTTADSDPWYVEASAAQLESAVINLVLNADQATATGGRIDICVNNVVNARNTEDLPVGEFVRIRVSDNGPGVPSHMLSQNADPVSCGEHTERSRGLGLAMVRRFVSQTSGVMRIESEEGEGVRAELWLPRCAQELDVTGSTTIPLSTLPHGSEKVLVAMSDSDVGNTVESLLDAVGYFVVKVDGRREALEAALVQRDLALVICDRSACDMASDTRWLTRLRSINPAIRQIAIVDHTDDFDHVAPDANACLRRPVTVPALARAMREAMEDEL